MLLLIVSISGLLLYFLWFSRMPDPPQRSRPVFGVVTSSKFKSIQEGKIMPTVAKVIELVGESEVSWDDAMRRAVQEASKTLDNITGVEVVNFTANVDGGEILEYKVNLKLGFGVREER